MDDKAAREKRYSVLMSVYHKDNPDWLKKAVDSMLAQTVKPCEFVMVKDGPAGETLDRVITEYAQAWPALFKIIQLPENVGVGLAKKEGVLVCTEEFIAIMDADDYSLPDRVEKEYAKFFECPELDVVGCLVDEFIDTIDHVAAHVILPETHEAIVSFAKKRCPIRHPSCLIRKDAILEAGNYRSLRFGEDYELIVRMIQNGCKIYNIPEVHHFVRISKNFYRRRGGAECLKKVYILKRTLLRNGFLSRGEFMVSFGLHMIIIIMPVRLRAFVYRRFLRD
ncbi:MAG: glycosyltransferase [Oscillospiraceae bacterium]|nr:glycosyltransferase [Oscillospiraceae bacterium]